MKRFRWLLVILSTTAVLGVIGWFNASVSMDPALALAIRESLGPGVRQPYRADRIYWSTLSGVRELRPVGVESLDGVQHCRNLRILTAKYGPLPSLEPLRRCSRLEVLDIEGLDNYFVPEDPGLNLSPLAELHALRELRLQDMDVRDLSPLTTLTRLKKLDISENPIENFEPLASLTGLEVLSLDRGDGWYSEGMAETTPKEWPDLTPLSKLANLVDLSIAGQEGLGPTDGIDFGDSEIVLQPLQSLTQLKRLDLSFNRLKDPESICGLTNLEELNLEYCQLDLPDARYDLQPLRDFVFLGCLEDLRVLQVGDLAMFGLNESFNADSLPALEELYIFGMWGDLRPVLTMPKLRKLSLPYSRLSSLSSGQVRKLSSRLKLEVGDPGTSWYERWDWHPTYPE